LALFVRIQKEVFAGQQLDLMTDDDVERMHDLKTGSYTTRGPAELGGILADADEAGMQSLRRWAAPLGVAFQLRDDLLGTFGNPQQTGKPGDDLRHGKHNAVVAAFGQLAPSAADRAVLEGVWGRADATDEDVLAATEVLSAAKHEVGMRLRFLADEARSALGACPFDDEAKRILEEVTRRLTDRGT
jgi:geranylgeranyl diphosphate synthase type I